MRPLDQYPDSFGSHKSGVFPHAGPAAYVQTDASISPLPAVLTGGDVVEGSEFGVKLIEFLTGSLSDDGLYFVRPFPKAQSDFQVGASQPTYGLEWRVSATGAQVAADVDLSASVVRLFALGVK